MFGLRLGHVIKNLALAMLNATLILLALCLWLAWKLSAEIDDITDDFASNLIKVQPLRDDIATLTGQVGLLRQDLEQLRGESAGAAEAAIARLSERTDQLDAGLTKVNGLFDRLSADPEALLDQATRSAVSQLANEAQDMMHCLPNAEDMPIAD